MFLDVHKVDMFVLYMRRSIDCFTVTGKTKFYLLKLKRLID